MESRSVDDAAHLAHAVELKGTFEMLCWSEQAQVMQFMRQLVLRRRKAPPVDLICCQCGVRTTTTIAHEMHMKIHFDAATLPDWVPCVLTI